MHCNGRGAGEGGEVGWGGVGEKGTSYSLLLASK